MATINCINQASEALVIGPIGVDTPDPLGYLLKLQKNQATGTGFRILNNNSGGFSILQTQADTVGGGLGGGIAQYGSATSDGFGGSNGGTFLFANAYSSSLNIVSEISTGNVRIGVGNSGTQQAIWNATGGQYRGYNSDTVPAAGYIGQRIASVVTGGSPIALTTATPTNLTSIDLTAGVWDVTLSVAFGSAVATTTVTAIGINTTSATLPNVNTEGDQRCMSPIGPTAVADTSLVVPAFRVYIAASTTTTYYGVVSATFTGMSMNATGRLSAVRVA